MNKRRALQGFTLIELSIVLVIIGLIAGGVLVGQELVRAAGVRATISQTEKFNAAVNTFYSKYSALPGDMSPVAAAGFGFSTRAGTAGNGDNNGIIEGTYVWNPSIAGYTEGQGETGLFWVDLTYANGMKINLVEGNFTQLGLGGANWTGSGLDLYFPQAKIGRGNYFYVYSTNALNYYGLSAISFLSSNGIIKSSAALTVSEAANIDQKVDDGNPQTGRVLAQYINYAREPSKPEWAGGANEGNLPGTATPSSSTTCYDNGGVAANPMQYSVEISGANANCALSFRFQ